MTRVVNWLLFALGLPIAILVCVALTTWRPGTAFIEAVTNEELLAVSFTLAGASGIDALTSTARPSLAKLQSGVGGLTILMGFITAVCYFIFKTHSSQLPPDVIRWVEAGLFLFTILVSFFSEVVA